MKTVEKKVVQAFGEHYLLFIDKDGLKHYLEFPSWDCGWYWGFGYIHTFTNNRKPELSRNISMLTHWDTVFGKKVSNNWLHEDPDIDSITVTQPEAWQLHELFKQFYLLREMAEFSGRKPVPGCHITTSEVNHGNLGQ